MEYYKLVFFLAIGVTLCYAKVDAATDANNVNPSEKSVNSTTLAEKQQNVATVQSSLYDLTWKTGLGHALVFVGAAAFSFVLVGGLTLLFAPIFGYKVCSILGNCEPVVTPYSATPSNGIIDNNYSLYSYPPPPAYNTYQQRSMDYIKPAEYIKPILETLAKAYEKSS